MMKVKVLASGSKGNCTYIETKKSKILIDIGITYQHLASELAPLNRTPNDLDAILITHTHSDHIKGLQGLVRKTNLPVYVSEKMMVDLQEKIPVTVCRYLEEHFFLNDIEVEIMHISHDVDSVGYILSNDKTSIVYVTDTGYINRRYLNRMKNKDLYIIESNHDEKMLMDGPYPFILKQRVLSDKGHLSNHTAAKYLQEIVGDKTKYIILAHISENNNTEELAYQTTKEVLEENHLDKPIIVAKQHESLETIEV